ncbi:hypothetical protein GCM10020227_00130 [Streptomyces flavovirens]
MRKLISTDQKPMVPLPDPDGSPGRIPEPLAPRAAPGDPVAVGRLRTAPLKE